MGAPALRYCHGFTCEMIAPGIEKFLAEILESIHQIAERIAGWRAAIAESVHSVGKTIAH